MNTWPFLALIWIHFLMDFVLQSRYTAEMKSKSNAVLLAHVVTYSLPLAVFGILFAVVNGGLHFLTDWITSRLTTRYYLSNRMKLFWVTIGADQAVHMTCLLLTFEYLPVLTRAISAL